VLYHKEQVWKNKLSNLYVEVSNPCRYDFREDIQWGSWEERNSYEGCRVYTRGYSDDAANYRGNTEVDFEVKPGMVVYPVLVVYGTGDTFGNSSGNVVLVDVFDDAEKARGLEIAIRESNAYTFIYEGKEYYSGTWTGYFEHLEDIIVETEVVRA
jgi:hypothetical protein